MRRRKFALMPESYKEELVRSSAEDLAAWNDERYKKAWQALSPEQQVAIIEAAASSENTGNVKRKRGREACLPVSGSSGAALQSTSPASQDDDDAIFLAGLELAEQQHASMIAACSLASAAPGQSSGPAQGDHKQLAGAESTSTHLDTIKDRDRKIQQLETQLQRAESTHLDTIKDRDRKIEELEKQLEEARRHAVAHEGTRQGNVDPSKLPRIKAETTVPVLKAEVKQRGLKIKNTSSIGKEGLLRALTVGSVLLSETHELKRYNEVLGLMAKEESAAYAARYQAQQRAEQQQLAERHRRAAEEKQRELQRLSALHTHTSSIHPCPLAPSRELPHPTERHDRRSETASCDLCKSGDGREILWSCHSCDFDVCAECYDIESLPEAQRPARRAELEEKRRQREQAEREKAALAMLKRKQEQLEREKYLREAREKARLEQERKDGELEQKICGQKPFRVEHKTVPAANATLAKGFVVYSTEGDSYHRDSALEFDSCWSKARDANMRCMSPCPTCLAVAISALRVDPRPLALPRWHSLMCRAKYLFYWKNCWGLSLEEMVGDEDGGGMMDVEVESKSGLDCMVAQGPEGDYWKVAVVPSAAFEHLPHARLPRPRGRACWDSDEEG